MNEEGSSSRSEDLREGTMREARRVCGEVLQQMKLYRTTLTQILYSDWDPEDGPPSDDDIDDLLLETETSLEEALASMEGLESEKMTTECMFTTFENLIPIAQLRREAEERVNDLISELTGKDESSVREHIQSVLGKTN
ncbi:hypothetical protein SAY87_005094 [Trapa incisa]|uniref:Uncharacterized protein n=1 Tax=Trapa incisa TaxID=236973 RepID=A0AAN7JR56_9MYRT|nr:hypothetical protein SAY87_005094 [Trapa incisa]